MAIELVAREIVNAILSADTARALSLIQDSQVAFSDPGGIYLHAEALYGAIKKANIAVISALFAMPVHSDVAFFKFCGTTPLSAAIEGGHEALLPLLLRKTDQSFALHMAVKLKLHKSRVFLRKNCFFKQKFLVFLGLS